MLKRTRSREHQLRQRANRGPTAVADVPEGMRRLVEAGVEALRDPAMERRVREHLSARGHPARDVISAALVAGRFRREAENQSRPISQSA